MEVIEKVKKDNFIVRLFKGDVPLPITYWIFGILIGGVGARILLAGIEFNYSQLAMDKNGLFLIQSAYWIIIAYSTFILISIWRSAGKYKGSSIWSGLAIGAVILNALSFTANFWMASDSEYALNEEIRMMNKSLPTMVDNDTRLDHVSIQEKNIFYNYTLTKWLAVELDLERFNSIMQPKIKTNACEAAETKSLLEEGRSLNYVYRDKDSKPVSKFTVTTSDCF
jgi:hypothetical protein